MASLSVHAGGVPGGAKGAVTPGAASATSSSSTGGATGGTTVTTAGCTGGGGRSARTGETGATGGAAHVVTGAAGGAATGATGATGGAATVVTGGTGATGTTTGAATVAGVGASAGVEMVEVGACVGGIVGLTGVRSTLVRTEPLKVPPVKLSYDAISFLMSASTRVSIRFASPSAFDRTSPMRLIENDMAFSLIVSGMGTGITSADRFRNSLATDSNLIGGPSRARPGS